MKNIFSAILILIVAAGGLWVYSNFHFVPSANQASASFDNPIKAEDYPVVATGINGRINEISPTKSFGSVGWIVEQVTFIPNTSLVYAEYTDTHVALKILLSASIGNMELRTKVIATFLPNESGGWDLQYGRDEGRGSDGISYIYQGDLKQWVRETK